MMNCRSRNFSASLGTLHSGEYESSIYLLRNFPRLLAFGGCLSQSARALSFLHCGGNT